MIIFFFLSLSVLVAIYFLNKSDYGYWKNRGVPGPTPKFFVGNVGESYILRKSLGAIFNDIYNKYQGVSLVGVYRGNTPVLLIRDLEMLKAVTVKEFQHFRDNEFTIDVKVDPLMGRHPFFLKGDLWKTTRALLTPCFTSGKMKSVYPLIEEVSRQLVLHIGTQPDATNGNGVEAKDLCTKFTLNNVASCAFGLEGKCFEDPNSEFRIIADRFIGPSNWVNIKLLVVTLIPVLVKIISIKFTPREAEDKLTNIVSQTLKYRKENNIVRNDFLHIMNELKEKSEDGEFSDIDVVAHASGFFGDGYETSSIVMSFILYQLANNQEVQVKLRKEIRANFSANFGRIPYEVLQEMFYLDAVFNETLRIHPPVDILTKICTSSYTYVPRPGDGIEKSSVTIEPGTPIVLPILGLQNDPKYYENPEQFKPERFIGKSRERLVKYAFLPFGEGPRACLGQKFGIMQIKAGIAYVLKDYELSVNKRTKRPLKYDPRYFMISPIGGLWINFKKIQE